MRRVVLTVLALLALAAPAAAQQSVVEKYRRQYPTPMSKEQLLALERSVASEVHGGLLRKPDGSSCGGYSCDIICFSDSELYDILSDSDGAATAAWNRTENPRGYHCELVTPAPPPTPDLEARIAALEQRIAALETKAGTSIPPPPPPPPTDVAADVKRIRELLELVARRFGLQ